MMTGQGAPGVVDSGGGDAEDASVGSLYEDQPVFCCLASGPTPIPTLGERVEKTRSHDNKGTI